MFTFMNLYGVYSADLIYIIQFIYSPDSSNLLCERSLKQIGIEKQKVGICTVLSYHGGAGA